MNKAHTVTVASVAVARAYTNAEAHVGRGCDIVVRSRPVVAVGTDIANRSPVPLARSRQEDRADTFKNRPLGG